MDRSLLRFKLNRSAFRATAEIVISPLSSVRRPSSVLITCAETELFTSLNARDNPTATETPVLFGVNEAATEAAAAVALMTEVSFAFNAIDAALIPSLD